MISIRNFGLLNDALQKPLLTVSDGLMESLPTRFTTLANDQSRPSTKGTNSALRCAYAYAAVEEDRPCPTTETAPCNFFYFR